MLNFKIIKAKWIIRRAYDRFGQDMALAWTGGKDSTVLLHLIREIFGNVPFKIVFNDSKMEFREVYEFIEFLKKEWQFKPLVVKHSKPRKKMTAKLVRELKIKAIEKIVSKHQLKALMSGIRRDEHESRSKEKAFSKRPSHWRIHPILSWTEADIWSYTRKYQVPYVKLYDKGYRSLGEAPFTNRSVKGGDERSGREADKEKLMKRLRSLGYW